MSALTEELEFYNLRTLAAAARVSQATLLRDRKKNLWKIKEAEIEDGLVTTFSAKKAATYVKMCRQTRKPYKARK